MRDKGTGEHIRPMKIIYIHGATASERSFAFIDSELKPTEKIFLNYDKDEDAQTNIKSMIEVLENTDGPFSIVAHSLGGLYAIYLQKEFPKVISNVVSLSTPFNGSEIATWGRYLNPGYQLFRDIHTHSKFVQGSKEIEITVPWLAIVSTKGDVPWLVGANDGIVTLDSMTCREDVDYKWIDRNHYEIVLSKRSVIYIQEFFSKSG